MKNFGNQDLSASFNVTLFTIGSYSSTKSVQALAQGADTGARVRQCTLGLSPRSRSPGTCATQLSSDMNRPG